MKKCQTQTVYHIVATPPTEVQEPKLELQLEESWLRDYKDNKFFLIDGLLYNREKNTSALTVIDRDHISLILQECHDCPYTVHMSEDRTKERVASTAWWPKWEQELSEYINTCERCQKENRNHGKKYGLLQHIEEPKNPWETINMDWVTELVPGGRENFNACLIIVDRFSKSTDCLAERMIQTMEDILSSFCAYRMENKDHEEYTNDWVTLLPAVQLAYNTSQHSTTGKSPSLVEKGWNPLFPVDHLKKNLLNIHPTSKDFHDMWERACDIAARCIAEEKEYNKQRWDKLQWNLTLKKGTRCWCLH
ncbi:hypothetical protein O181_016339 [Austropuccinia psidii MF-1]|uniref:Integrase zinc-binding domain-containing protein n=1 Tax=Austropuccinia psidii MF-1 TaxID=1389203 RepID=A0A9Q3C1I4_9BASI|nr:hypothetical protein [Austropuccinia psidii MF-1]